MTSCHVVESKLKSTVHFSKVYLMEYHLLSYHWNFDIVMNYVLERMFCTPGGLKMDPSMVLHHKTRFIVPKRLLSA
jgi:hypothetical protein